MSRKQNPSGTANIQTGRKKKKISIRHTWPYHLLLFPGMMVLLIYTVVPFLGNVIAFQNFKPIMGIAKSKWVGFENFTYMFKLPDTFKIFRNTLVIAIGKLTFNLVMSVFFAIIKEPIVFLGNNSWFQGLMIGTDVWKEFGYGAIIFIAALTSINTELYEAAAIDGAGRLQRIWHITLPGIAVTIVLVATLNIANILNAGFDQIYNLYSPIVYSTGDIIDTYVYRMSFENAQYSLATAIGLLKSLVSFILIVVSNFCAGKFANYRIF